MMKRIWATVWATCMALTAALALAQTSEEIALAAYPSCTVKASASGNGFDAFALGNGEKTALCIVENGVLTVANERLFETGQGIQVFVDTDGESLFLDYDTEYARVSLHAVYRNGAWSDADVTCFEQNESGGVPTYPETHWYAEGGLLHVRYAVYDENENEQTGSRIEYEIPVGTDFDMSLGGIDMTRFPKSVEQLDTTYDAFPTGAGRAAAGRRGYAAANRRVSGVHGAAASKFGRRQARARQRAQRQGERLAGQRDAGQLGHAGSLPRGRQSDFSGRERQGVFLSQNAAGRLASHGQHGGRVAEPGRGLRAG